MQDTLADLKWKKAMNEEMKALQKKLYLETCPYANWNENCWVFTIKLNANASINKYKERLIAKGYTQQYGVDYQKTFAHLININTI